MTKKQMILTRTGLGFVIAAIAALITQMVPFSLRRLLIEPPVLTGPELWMLECGVGFLNSVVVTAIALAILRRPALHISVASIVAQILWIEWAYYFRHGGGTVMEMFLRYAEHVGVVAGGFAAMFGFAWVMSKKAAA